MKKFLLVVIIGMVLAMDVYGVVKEHIDSVEKAVDKHVTVVYVE